MPHRYPWEATQSIPLSSITPSTPTTTTIRTSTYPYKHVTNLFATTVSKYTRTIINNLYTDQYKTRYNNNNSNDSNNGIGGVFSTTTRRSNFFNSYYIVSTTPKVTYGPKVSPFKYKNMVISFSTTTKGYQNGLRNDGRGKRILYLFLFYLPNFTSSHYLILHDRLLPLMWLDSWNPIDLFLCVFSIFVIFSDRKFCLEEFFERHWSWYISLHYRFISLLIILVNTMFYHFV